jgi:hypothetical protein
VLWCDERYGIFEYTPMQLVASLEAETRDVSKHFGHESDEPEKATSDHRRRDGPRYLSLAGAKK